MNPISLRETGQNDLDVVARYITALNAHHGFDFNLSVKTLSHLNAIENSGITTLLIHKCREPIGLCVLNKVPRLHKGLIDLNIHLLYIDETHRGQSVAREVMKLIKEQAQRDGIAALRVSADLQNEAAQQAYLALGFERRETAGAHFYQPLT